MRTSYFTSPNVLQAILVSYTLSVSQHYSYRDRFNLGLNRNSL